MTSVVVAHGALGSARQMQPVVDALRAVGDGRWTVRVLEFPGHGDTPLDDSDAFRLARFVERMADAIPAGDDPPILFGYSMGGYVGLALESSRPGTFAGIVTLGTKFEWTPDAAEHAAARLDPSVLAAKVPQFAATLAERHRNAGGWETVVSRTATLMRANAAAPLLSAETLERIGIPVTVAVGSLDDTVGVAEAQAAADLMPRARTEVLAGIGHPIERVPVDRIVSLVTELARTIRPTV